MPVLQISLSLEHALEHFSKIIDLLGENAINVIGFSVGNADSVRFVANDPEKAAEVLKTQGYRAKLKPVLAVEAPNHPGGLNAILRPLNAAGIKVNYLYTCLTRGGDHALLIVDVDKTEKAISALRENWVHLLDDELYSM
jgi:hypothetical protein